MTDFYTAPSFMVAQHGSRNFFKWDVNYDVYDPNSQLLARVHEIDVGAATHAMRWFMEDSGRTGHTLEVSDPHGTPILLIDKPFAVAMPKTQVKLPDGAVLGEIARQLSIGGGTFDLHDAGDRPLGRVSGNLTGHDFAVHDTRDLEIARIHRSFDGFWNVIDAFSINTHDCYAVEVPYQLPEPLRSLVLAAPFAIDVVVHEDSEMG